MLSIICAVNGVLAILGIIALAFGSRCDLQCYCYVSFWVFFVNIVAQY